MNKKDMLRLFLGLFLMIAGIGVGLWLGVWVLFVGGWSDVIEQIRAPVMDSGSLMWGIMKIVFSGGCGWISFYLFFYTGIKILQDK